MILHFFGHSHEFHEHLFSCKNLWTNVHSSFIHTSQKLETQQHTSKGEWWNKLCTTTQQPERNKLLIHALLGWTGSELYRIKRPVPGLPWWCSGWESACQCRGHGFEPWSGKIPHAAEQLGPWATITESARLEPVLRNKRGRDSERPAHRDEEWPPLATTTESPRTETKTQHSH